MKSVRLEGQDLETAVARIIGYYEWLNTGNIRPPEVRTPGNPPPPRYLHGAHYDDLLMWLTKRGSVESVVESDHARAKLRLAQGVTRGNCAAEANGSNIYEAICRLVLTVAESQ